MESIERQALPRTLQFPLLLEFFPLNSMSTINQDAILRRILGGCKGKLPVVEVGGSGVEDFKYKECYEMDVIICPHFYGKSCEAGEFE